MLDKDNDIIYLGYEVDRKKILTTVPVFYPEGLKTFAYYVLERQNILKKRQQGLAPMWTEDKILQNNRFTNIRRENDRVSRWLIEHISNNPNLSLNDKLWRSMIFRMYNTIHCAELIHLDDPNFWNDVEEYAKILEKVEHDSEIYTNAYRIVQVKAQYKKFFPTRQYRCHILLYINGLRKEWEDIAGIVSENADVAYRWILKNMFCAGPFLAYQIFVDWTYIPEFPISENHYVVAGPGCRIGLSFLVKDFQGLSAEEIIFWIRNNFSYMFKDYPDLTPEKLFDNEPEENRNWNVMSIENILCEFSKYNYCLNGSHRKPRRYRYNKEDIK